MKMSATIALLFALAGCGVTDPKTKTPQGNFEIAYANQTTVWTCIGKNMHGTNEALVISLLKKDGSSQVYSLDASRVVLQTTGAGYTKSIQGILNIPVTFIESDKKDYWIVQDLTLTDLNNVHPIVALYDGKLNNLIFYPKPKENKSIMIDCSQNRILSGSI